MAEIISLLTKDGEVVVELDPKDDLVFYMMLSRGTLPNVILWGDRVFVRGRTNEGDNRPLFFEEFAVRALTGMREK